ncbi:MAG: ferrochelatase [Acaryochloris sp. RU_4_1]|nr:ferrochelatase [Acaryochloris sp. RU_4_1]NJR53317.1 ferrochelatase [Acaryochloris sp. CRU_2_0]
MGRVGVLLLNLGGPEQLTDVRPFLYNLFADPEILRLPFTWLQKPFAGFISTLRARTSRENYRQIGGGSPLRRITEAQAHALQDNLQAKGCEAQVYIGMRYWHPFTEEAIARIKRDGIEELVILPLYPQFSISTSGSSIRLLEKIWAEDPDLQQIKYTVISSWHDRPGYVRVMADFLRRELDHFCEPDQVTVFFSAHGVPLSYVTDSGDPYQQEIETSTQLIMEALQRPNPHILAYQSRVGPMEWLRPYTTNVIPHLGQQGVKNLVVVPISFISEHIETLQEIDMEYRHLALASGIENFRRIPAVNTHPDFINTLGDMVLEYLDKPFFAFSQVFRPQKNIKLYPQERWEWGMTTTAERWNGRLAMIGFIALMIELISGYGPLHLVGLL